MKKRISMAIAVATAAAMMTGAAVPVMADDVNITIFNSKMEVQSQFEELAAQYAEDPQSFLRVDLSVFPDFRVGTSGEPRPNPEIIFPNHPTCT